MPSFLAEDNRNRKADALKRLGVDAESLKGVARISHLLSRADGGLDAVIEALRADDDPTAQAFLAKRDELSASDLDVLTIEDICIAIDVLPRRFLGVCVAALANQSDSLSQIIVASSKPKVVEKTAQLAAAGNIAAMDHFHKHTGFLPQSKGIAVNVDNRQQTQNISTPAPERESALPPPSADSFLLELQGVIRPEQKQLEAPLEPVLASVSAPLAVEYVEEL